MKQLKFCIRVLIALVLVLPTYPLFFLWYSLLGFRFLLLVSVFFQIGYNWLMDKPLSNKIYFDFVAKGCLLTFVMPFWYWYCFAVGKESDLFLDYFL